MSIVAKKIAIGLLGASLAICLVFGTSEYIAGAIVLGLNRLGVQKTVGCLVAARRIPAGKLIENKDLEFEYVPEARMPQDPSFRRGCALKRVSKFTYEKGDGIGMAEWGL